MISCDDFVMKNKKAIQIAKGRASPAMQSFHV